MVKIKGVVAREILDSRGNPTVEVDVVCENGLFRASVPSGKSTGIYEAIELRDNDKRRYNGNGVLKAVHNVNTIIAENLIGKDVEKQKDIDNLMIKLDGTKNKSCLGANAILGVSMAVCRAGASARKISLYEYIAELSKNSELILPVPSFNVINGGRHAENKLSFQEFMVLPVGAENFKEAMRIGSEIYYCLKKLISEKYGKASINIGDEGGFSPNIDNEECLKLLKKAITISGYSNKVKIGIDVAASEFFEKGSYNLGFKENKKDLKSGDEMIKIYKKFVKDYGIISIEDPFEQDDWKNYLKLNKNIGDKIQIVGDDMLVTNTRRIKEAILKKACNTLLLKINQIGTISESIDACNMARKAGWNVMVSHRSGETEDSFIADLVVGLGVGEIKAGAPCRSERLAKYNQLVKIEEELIKKGMKVKYFGKRMINGK
jgi:enolase